MQLTVLFCFLILISWKSTVGAIAAQRQIIQIGYLETYDERWLCLLCVCWVKKCGTFLYPFLILEYPVILEACYLFISFVKLSRFCERNFAPDNHHFTDKESWTLFWHKSLSFILKAFKSFIASLIH